MIVEINTDFLAEKLVNPTEYCYLYALFLKDFDAGSKVALLDGKVQLDPASLEKRGWIKIEGPTIQEVQLRQCAIDLFQTNSDVRWAELCNTFPYKVPNRTGGQRPLRSLDPNSKSNEKAKKRYLTVSKNGRTDLHERIMQGLQAELAERKKSNSMAFMQNIDTWLLNRTYEKYEGTAPDITETGNTTAI